MTTELRVITGTRFGAWLNVRDDSESDDTRGAFAEALEIADARLPGLSSGPGARMDVWNSPAGRHGDTRLGFVWPILDGDIALTRFDEAFLRAISDGAAAGRPQALYTSLPDRDECRLAADKNDGGRAGAMLKIVRRHELVVEAGVTLLIFDGACGRLEDVAAVRETLDAAGMGHVAIGVEPWCAEFSGFRMCSDQKAARKIRTGDVPGDGLSGLAVLCHGLNDAANPRQRGPNLEELMLFHDRGLALIIGRLSPGEAETVRGLAREAAESFKARPVAIGGEGVR